MNESKGKKGIIYGIGDDDLIITAKDWNIAKPKLENIIYCSNTFLFDELLNYDIGGTTNCNFEEMEKEFIKEFPTIIRNKPNGNHNS